MTVTNRRHAVLMAALTLLATCATSLVGPLASAYAGAPATGSGEDASTVVSLTFDEGWSGQKQAGDLLAEHGLAGTFYVNAGKMSYPDRMSLADLQGLRASGQEIGGHTVTQEDLTSMSTADATWQVCTDRAMLVDEGFRTVSFAYPYNDYNANVARIVEHCGYDSGRLTSGLDIEDGTCTDCPSTQELPLGDNRFAVRAAADVGAVTLAELQARVVRAEATGGWLPLTFNDVCDGKCAEGGVSLDVLAAFVTWLESRPASTEVLPVREVTGGEFHPVVDQRMEPLGFRPDTAGSGSDVAFTVGGFGVDQSQLIIGGLLLAVVLSVGYRLSTRGRRYTGGNP